MPKDNLYGLGLYVTPTMMGSCLYYERGCTLLIVMLENFPTIYLKDQAIKAELRSNIISDPDDLKNPNLLGEYLCDIQKLRPAHGKQRRHLHKRFEGIFYFR